MHGFTLYGEVSVTPKHLKSPNGFWIYTFMHKRDETMHEAYDCQLSASLTHRLICQRRHHFLVK